MRRELPRLAALTLWAATASPIYSAGPVVLLVGPPGSGRTTQARLLSQELGMPVIAADDLIARNPQKFRKNRNPSDARADPHLDDAMNQLVAQALETTDLSRGVLLDGYPASKAQGDFLQKLRQKHGLPRAIVIHLTLPDNVARSRLNGQGRDVEQELKDYHREFDFVRDYFPEADIRSVDGTRKPDEIAKEIRKQLEEAAK